MKLNEFECLRLWMARIREDRSVQYTYEKRQEHIEKLMELLIDNEVDQDSAQMLKNKVVEALVTKEGMKGNGKHKNWKENAQNDFDDAIQLTYVEPHLAKRIKPMKDSQGFDPRIVTWAKKKFGNDVREDVIVAAHQPLHLFWIMFIDEHYDLKGKLF